MARRQSSHQSRSILASESNPSFVCAARLKPIASEPRLWQIRALLRLEQTRAFSGQGGGRPGRWQTKALAGQGDGRPGRWQARALAGQGVGRPGLASFMIVGPSADPCSEFSFDATYCLPTYY